MYPRALVQRQIHTINDYTIHQKDKHVQSQCRAVVRCEHQWPAYPNAPLPVLGIHRSVDPQELGACLLEALLQNYMGAAQGGETHVF